MLNLLRGRKPLIHCISNLVTANDCANLALVVGASPIMAQAPQEMAVISASADAVVINTGTPDEEKFEACRLAAQTARAHGVPLVLDPVGVGASPWRLEHVRQILSEAAPDILRVNYSEAAALLLDRSAEHGVDSLPAGSDAATLARTLARALRCAVVLSGADDLVTDGETLYTVTGGSDRMQTVTGAGCMLSVLCGVFAAAVPNRLEAARLAAVFWKRCAGQAARDAARRGSACFRAALLDAASLFDAAET